MKNNAQHNPSHRADEFSSLYRINRRAPAVHHARSNRSSRERSRVHEHQDQHLRCKKRSRSTPGHTRTQKPNRAYAPSSQLGIIGKTLSSPKQCTAFVLLVFVSIMLITLVAGPFPAATHNYSSSSRSIHNEELSNGTAADLSSSDPRTSLGSESETVFNHKQEKIGKGETRRKEKKNIHKQGIATISDDLSVDYATADSLTVLINKNHPTPENFVPKNIVPVNQLGVPVFGTAYSMRSDAAQAMARMYSAANTAGAPFILVSGYRSIATQQTIFETNTQISGKDYAETYSARPRYSEHHTGLAADVADTALQCNLVNCFADTAAGKWLAAHSWEYGYILRYPRGYENVTGYIYEPWHFRYIGQEVAAAYHESGAHTYEEFLGITPTPHYPDE